jgi:hypothetical protein
MLDQILSFIPAHDARFFELLCALFSTFSLLFALFKRTVWLSKLFGTVTPADLGRAWRYVLKAIELLQLWRASQKAKAVRNAMGVLITLGVIVGCAGTFEEAKLAGHQARTAAPPVAASSPERCQSLSEREYWFTGTGLGLVAVGAAAASMALPVQSKTLDFILIAGGTATTVTGGGLTWFGTAAGVNYVREECPK